MSSLERSDLVAADGAAVQSALELVPDGVVGVDLDGRIVLVNRQAERLFGYARDELLGARLEVLVPEHVRAAHQVHRESYMEDPRVRPMGSGLELSGRRRDGTEFPAEISLSYLRRGDGLIAVAAVRDVSERRRIEQERRRALEEMETAQRIAGIGSWTWDTRSDTATWSGEMYRIFGRAQVQGPAINEDLLAYVHPDDRDRLADGYRAMTSAGESFELDYRIVRPDGSQRVLHAVGRRESSQPGCYAGTVQDVTALRAAEQRLADRERLLSEAQALAHVGSWEWDLSEPRMQCSDELCRIFGQPLGFSPTLAELTDLVHPEDREGVAAALSEPRAAVGDSRHRILRPSGEMRYVHARRYGITDSSGRVFRLYGTVQDVTERTRYEAELERLAAEDPLTGLANQRVFQERLWGEVARQIRSGRPLSVAILDLDHFKHVNDRYGHVIGDSVLREVARRLEALTREGEMLARVGGEEFAWILPEATAEGALMAAERARHAVSAEPVGPVARLTLSVGVCDLASAPAPTEVYRLADEALYVAKRHGRNRTVSYSVP